MIKIAAALAWFSGLGFGLPGIYGIWHMAQGRGVARFMGFPTYGHGVFERFGVPSSVPLMLSFVLVCAIECVVGWMLWENQRAGAVLALGLLPIETFFWVGFSLPFGPVAAVLRTGLIVFAWSQLAGVTVQ